MTGAGVVMDFTDKKAAIEVSLKFLVGISGMVLSGATLGTLVRTLTKPGRTQNTLIVVALISGIFATSLFDAWSSNEIEAGFREYSGQKEYLQEVEKKRAELSMHFTVLNALIAGALYFWLAGGIAFIRYWREPVQMQAYFEKQELASAKADKHDAEAKLSMLQAQIEPHFLFNSLASVKSVLREKPELAEGTIDNLVDYLRASIPRLDGNNQVENLTLGQQIELCGKYLEVMKLRMGERLSYTLQVDPRIMNAHFPSLVITSLVENAIKHGIEPSKNGGNIDITATYNNQELNIIVSDNGQGLNQNQNNELSSGVGLANIKAQLEVLYGDKCSLELSENTEGGVIAKIIITEFTTNL